MAAHIKGRGDGLLTAGPLAERIGSEKIGFNGKGGVDITFSADGTQEAGYNAFLGASAGLYVGDGGNASGGVPSQLKGRAGELVGVEGAAGTGGLSAGGNLGVGTPYGGSVTVKDMPLASKTIPIC